LGVVVAIVELGMFGGCIEGAALGVVEVKDSQLGGDGRCEL